jgi:hypothetical protein
VFGLESIVDYLIWLAVAVVGMLLLAVLALFDGIRRGVNRLSRRTPGGNHGNP